MKGFILYPSYKIIDGKSYVFLFGKLENGESFLVMNFYEPYFYIKTKDVKKAGNGDFKIENSDFKSFNDEKLSRVILETPKDVPGLRRSFEEDGIECYEADIRFAYRYLMDKEIMMGVEIDGDYETSDFINRIYRDAEIKPIEYFPNNLKIFSVDIETSSNGKKLYSIAIYSEGFEKVLIDMDEEEMLEEFKKIILEEDPDIITGWNLIDFDLEYLKNKFKEHRISFVLGRTNETCKIRIEKDFFRDSKADFPGRVVLDGIQLLRMSFVDLDSYKLEDAAQSILKEGKLISYIEGKGEEIDRLFREDKKKLAKYNLNDARLVTEILKKTKIIEMTIERSILTGMPLDRVNASIASLDSLYLRELNKRGYVANSGHYTPKEERIKGGYVMESKPGIYDYLLVLDFKSLYPSLMRTFNIDPLSYVENCNGKNLIKAPNGACFKNQNGVMGVLVERLLKSRDKAKKEKNELQRHAIKILLNSFFGVLANANCRFFSLDVANAITHFGQKMIKLTAEKVEEEGYEVIYSDSITKDRFTTLIVNGKLLIISMEELFKKFISKKVIIGKKERIDLRKENVLALTVNKETLEPEFSKLNEIIRHKTNKKVFRVNQKYGETICSEDHSLIIFEDNKLKEVRPLEIEKRPLFKIVKIPDLPKIVKIDIYEYLKNYSYKVTYKGRIKTAKAHCDDKWVWFGWTNRKKSVRVKRFIDIKSKEFESLCRLVGAYIAEGSSSTPETTKSRLGASISSSNVNWLKSLKEDYYKLFDNVDVSIIVSTKKIRELKYFNGETEKNISYVDKTQKLQLMNILSAVFFKSLAGQNSNGKRVPYFMFHVDEKYKKILLDTMIEGDGSRKSKDKRYSEQYKLKHFSYCTNSLGLTSDLSTLLTQLRFNYSIRYKKEKSNYTITTSNKNNSRIKTNIEEIHYEDYLYDLSVDKNKTFVDACGNILLHNTDSVFVLSKAENLEEAEKIGNELNIKLNKFFESYVKKEYNRNNHLELEYEKCFVRFLMPRVRGSETGAKKRYAGLNSKGKIEITGMEAIRGDWTELAKKFQMELLDRLFHKKEVKSYIKKLIEEVKDGRHDKDLVYRKQIRKNLEDYAMNAQHVKAAKKLKNFKGSVIEYVITEDGPEPIQNQKHKLDYKHYIDKQIKPIANAVLIFFNITLDELLEGSTQVDLNSFSK